MENNFVADKEKCTKCGFCESICAVGIIKKDKEGYPYISDKDKKSCFKCQHCMCICPKGAISVLGKNPDNSTMCTNSINSDDLLNLIKSRRSIRQYKQENITKEDMQKLKDILSYPPTGCNYRGLYFSVIEDIDIMQKFKGEVYKKIKKIVSNKLVKFVLRDFAPFIEGILEGKDVIFLNAPHMLVVAVDKKSPCKNQDPIIALSYFEIYAKSLGIGTCWCGFASAILQIITSLRKSFNIPNGYKIAYTMLFGYPKVSFSRTAQQEPYKITSAKL